MFLDLLEDTSKATNCLPIQGCTFLQNLKCCIKPRLRKRAIDIFRKELENFLSTVFKFFRSGNQRSILHFQNFR